jgi:hypothetical protein
VVEAVDEIGLLPSNDSLWYQIRQSLKGWSAGGTFGTALDPFKTAGTNHAGFGVVQDSNGNFSIAATNGGGVKSDPVSLFDDTFNSLSGDLSGPGTNENGHPGIFDLGLGSVVVGGGKVLASASSSGVVKLLLWLVVGLIAISILGGLTDGIVQGNSTPENRRRSRSRR